MIVSPNHAPALSEAVTALLKNETNARRFAESAFKDAQAFSAEIMGKKYVELYDQLIKPKSNGIIH